MGMSSNFSTPKQPISATPSNYDAWLASEHGQVFAYWKRLAGVQFDFIKSFQSIWESTITDLRDRWVNAHHDDAERLLALMDNGDADQRAQAEKTLAELLKPMGALHPYESTLDMTWSKDIHVLEYAMHIDTFARQAPQTLPLVHELPHLKPIEFVSEANCPNADLWKLIEAATPLVPYVRAT